MKTTLAHVDEPLAWETATALGGGAALYVLAQVGFKARALGSVSVPRVIAAAVLTAVIPVARQVDAVVTVGLVAAVLWVLLAFETVRYAEARTRIRHGDEGA